MIETAITAVAVYSLFEPYWLKIRQFELKSGKIPASFDGRTVIFISDIHCGPSFSIRRVKRLVKKINRLRPDVIILGGDYVTRHENRIIPVFKELKKLKPKIASFGVMGNHDWDTNPELIRKGMRDAGIKMLENRGCWVQIGEEKIRIGGVSEITSDIPQDITPTLEETTEDDFILLVSHNPSLIDNVPEGTVDFILSGHTHGGQLAPVGAVGSILNKIYELLRKILPPSLSHTLGLNNGFSTKHRKGIVSENGAKMIVSTGVGTSVLPIRFMSNPEIVHITLKKI
ncbi:MAG: metallophosphoesterase [Candidatus Colwellbacteria bacterium]|nr:metallophosphoesterase [Candidatus Colwellbacteria bacterium]